MIDNSWTEMKKLIATDPVQLDILLSFADADITVYRKEYLHSQLSELLGIFCTLNAELRNEFHAQPKHILLKPLVDVINTFTRLTDATKPFSIDSESFLQDMRQIMKMIETEKKRITEDFIQAYRKAPSHLKDQLIKTVIIVNPDSWWYMHRTRYRSSSLDELPNPTKNGLHVCEWKDKSGKRWQLGNKSARCVRERRIPQWAFDIVKARIGWFGFHLSLSQSTSHRCNLSSIHLFLPNFIRDAVVEEFNIDIDKEREKYGWVGDTPPSPPAKEKPLIIVLRKEY